MSENLIETSYNITGKSKIRNFYDKYKIIIFSIFSIALVIIALISFYFKNEENKKIILSENYISAKLYIKNQNKDKAREILKDIVLKKDRTYSALALFLILDENLMKEKKDLINLFNYAIETKPIDKELKNLIIFKKMLYQADYSSEVDLLETAKKLINTETIWKPNALLLIADYFVSKKEYSKAKEFYSKVLLLKNIHKDIHEYSAYQLANISNE